MVPVLSGIRPARRQIEVSARDAEPLPGQSAAADDVAVGAEPTSDGVVSFGERGKAGKGACLTIERAALRESSEQGVARVGADSPLRATQRRQLARRKVAGAMEQCVAPGWSAGAGSAMRQAVGPTVGARSRGESQRWADSRKPGIRTQPAQPRSSGRVGRNPASARIYPRVARRLWTTWMHPRLVWHAIPRPFIARPEAAPVRRARPHTTRLRTRSSASLGSIAQCSHPWCEACADMSFRWRQSPDGSVANRWVVDQGCKSMRKRRINSSRTLRKACRRCSSSPTAAAGSGIAQCRRFALPR